MRTVVPLSGSSWPGREAEVAVPVFAPHPSLLTLVAPAEGRLRDSGASSAVEDGSAYFPQSVASGEPGADGVVLWTRAVDPSHPGAPLVLTLQVARDEHFAHRVLEVPGLCTTPVRDHTLKVRVTNLAPSTRYHYRFVLEKNGRTLGSPRGRTRTGPAPASDRPLHFVVASYRDLLGSGDDTGQRLSRHEEDLDFILLLGDSLHEEGSFRGLSARARRDLCRAWRTHPVVRQVHAHHPFLVLWEGDVPGSGWEERTRRILCDYLPIRPSWQLFAGRPRPAARPVVSAARPSRRERPWRLPFAA
ncbi:PhoD-like phosphatase N-terminal domain-containing protein [Cystobacter fuscus]|uniref:PhoD-like phosphatase N-terminal domain-containing protein n=1 Tax=Cystobacter fuscus TaxID=43 RepID=UPI00138AD480|nr:PhoD-like phosphatase N-terminal domain-containing protein [Cystobacter fuscus]